MKDVIYAGFAQLSYLEWHKLDEKALGNEDRKLNALIKDKFMDTLKNEDYENAVNNKKMKKDNDDYYFEKQTNKEGKEVKIYAANDCRMFILYSEDEVSPLINPKFKDFDEWKFLCAYDVKKIKEEEPGLLSNKNCDFQASAFYNEKTRDVMVVYRGSDDRDDEIHRKGDWENTNVGIALFNKYVEAFVCTAWFYEKVKTEMKNKSIGNYNIRITGHSMGGALSEFAFVYSGGFHRTKTWNGLGIGERDKAFEIHSAEKISIGLLEMVLEKLRYSYNGIWQPKCENANINIGEIIECYNEMEKLQTSSRGKYGNQKIENLNLENFTKEIKFKLKMMHRFQCNYDKVRDGCKGKIENFYMERDLTPNIHERRGEINKLNLEQNSSEQQYDNGGTGLIFGVTRKVGLTALAILGITNLGDYHSVTNFLPFFDDKGMLTSGKLHPKYELNAIKTITQFTKDLQKKTEEIIKENRKIDFDKEYLDWLTVRLTGITHTNEFHSKSFMEALDNNLTKKLLFFDNIEKAIKEKYNKKWYEIDEKYGVLGKFTNYNDIGGVIGGVPIKIEHKRNVSPIEVILHNAENKTKKVDTVTLDFLKEYHKSYKMTATENDIIYSVSIDLLKEGDLTVFKLMNEIVLKMKEYLKNTKDTKSKGEGTQFVQNVRRTLENTMAEGYVKNLYLKDNNGIEQTQSLELKKKLVSEFGGVIGRMKRCSEFFKSFITEDELNAEKNEENEKLEREREAKRAEEDKKAEEEARQRAEKENIAAAKAKEFEQGQARWYS